MEERNEKTRSEAYFAELSEHRSKGDANAANAEGTIFPRGEPIESTGRYAHVNTDREENEGE